MRFTLKYWFCSGFGGRSPPKASDHFRKLRNIIHKFHSSKIIGGAKSLAKWNYWGGKRLCLPPLKNYWGGICPPCPPRISSPDIVYQIVGYRPTWSKNSLISIYIILYIIVSIKMNKLMRQLMRQLMFIKYRSYNSWSNLNSIIKLIN